MARHHALLLETVGVIASQSNKLAGLWRGPAGSSQAGGALELRGWFPRFPGASPASRAKTGEAARVTTVWPVFACFATSKYGSYVK